MRLLTPADMPDDNTEDTRDADSGAIFLVPQGPMGGEAFHLCSFGHCVCSAGSTYPRSIEAVLIQFAACARALANAGDAPIAYIAVPLPILRAFPSLFWVEQLAKALSEAEAFRTWDILPIAASDIPRDAEIAMAREMWAEFYSVHERARDHHHNCFCIGCTGINYEEN